MSPPDSSRAGIPVEKPQTNVYTVMLIISLIAIMIACLLLWLEGSRFGPGLWWRVPT